MKRHQLLFGLFIAAGLAVFLFGTRREPHPSSSRVERPAAIAAAPEKPAAAPGTPASPPSVPAKATDAGRAAARAVAFPAWLSRWRAADASEKPALLTEGKALAASRATAMLTLMRKSPDAALAQALTWSEWTALPPEVRALVEEPFSVTGQYDARTDCRPMAERRGGPLHLTWLRTDAGELKVYPTPIWREVQGKSGVPVQGIRLSGEAVLQPGVMQVLNAEDAAAVASRMPLRAGFEGGPVTALIGGERLTFPDQATAQRVADELRATLPLNGPNTVAAGLAVLYSSSAALRDGLPPGSITAAAVATSSVFTTTPKTVLGLRIRFTDNANTPYTQAAFTTNLAAASSTVSDMSYGKTSLVSTVTGLLALPNPTTFYADGNGNVNQGQLDTDAKAAATAAGFTPASYDFLVYSCPAIPAKGAGPNSGGHDINMYDNATVATLMHEVGHSYGLPHANFWVGQLAGGDFLRRNGINTAYGPAGNDEYGDTFDVMAVEFRLAPNSNNVYPAGHIAMSEKAYLGWIDPAAVTNATTSGTYRIYRFDDKNAAAQTADKLALKFSTADGLTFWAGHRRNYTNNPSMSTGVYLVWADRPNGHQQIDCTPLSRLDAFPAFPTYDQADLDRDDCALPVGVSWTSPDGSVRLTNLANGGTAPFEYLDVQLEFLSAAPPPAYGFSTDAQATTPGLTGSYFNKHFGNGGPLSTQADWVTSQTRAGVRVDNPPNFPGPGWGVRSTVGITGGTDAVWDNFSVQWDGYVTVNAGQAIQLAARNDNGCRFWVDVNGNGTFEDAELANSAWGFQNGVATGGNSPTLQPGTYKIRVQYYQLDAATYPTEPSPSFQFVPTLLGHSNFELYQDQALTAYGLTSQYVNASLRGVSSQADWSTTQTISGTRADPIPLYWDNQMGPRAPVHITGGPADDSDWQNFSVQHDGWLKVLKRTRFISYGSDGTRFWIDTDGNGTFGTTAPEYDAGNWGQNGAQRFGAFSGWVDPGTYRIRIQHEQDADGGNRFAFMGQNTLVTSTGQGINLAGSGYVSAPAGTAISGAFTVEAWVRPATTGTLTILSTRNDFGFDMKVQNGNLVHGDIGTASSWLTTNADAAYTYRPGEWYHIAYCVGGGGYDIYVNGWKAGTGTYSGTPVLCDATHPFKIGTYNGVQENFNGDMDEVRVWNVKRTGEEIAANFRHILRSNLSGLASCWRLDETSGSAVADLIGARTGSYSGTVSKVALQTPVAGGSTLTVTSNADSGPGSLRDTIALANTLTGPVTINVTATGTIREPVTDIILADVTGQITINGPGAGLLTLNGADSNGVKGGILAVEAGASLTIRNVTLANGGLGGDASAIANRGGDVLMEDCVVRNCGSGFALGGACFNGGDFTARRCTFSGNGCGGGNGTDRGAGTSGGGGGGGAGWGGAIFSQVGALVLEDCVFTGNTATGGKGGTGGENAPADTTGGNGGGPNGGLGATSSGVTGSAGGLGGGGGGGGGFFGIGGAGGFGGAGGGGGASVGGGTGGAGGAAGFGAGSGGTAMFSFAGGGGGGAGLGGALYVHSGTATITRCTFSGNTVTGGLGGTGSFGAGNGANGQSLGGAIFNEATMNLSACTLDSNTASGAGGGIYSLTGGLGLLQCTLSGNASLTDRGGAIACRNTLGLTQCTLSGNSAAIDSGGIRQDVGTLFIQNSIVAGNTAGNAGDLFLGAPATLSRLGANLVQSFGADGGVSTSGPAFTSAPPLLAPLDNYGGPTKTMALKPLSPARDAAVGSSVTSDQRGFPLVSTPDLGAYEAGTLTNYNAWIWELLPAPATVAQHATTFDFDADGASNFNEWLAQTSPGDPSSYLRITQTSLSPTGHIIVTFPSVSGRNYTYEYTFSLATPITWTPTGSAFPGTGTPITKDLGSLAPFTQLFLRLRVGP